MENGLLVIGCGLPRTGTLSTKTALEILLPGRCHHIVSAFNHQDTWLRILSGKSSDEEIKSFFVDNKFTSGVDAPFCFIYKQIMKIFPKAKVLLTHRNAESWNQSMKDTIIQEQNSFYAFPACIFFTFNLFTNYFHFWPVLQQGLLQNGGNTEMLRRVREDSGVEFYNEWVASVEQVVPKDKLLKFSVTEGWEPLCKFLQCDVPLLDFPRVNTSGDFVARVGRRRRRSWVLFYELITIPLFLAIMKYQCY